MKYFQKLYLFLIPLIICLVGAAVSVNAEENVGFAIKANLPENQKKGNSTYFDLMVSPGQTQELTINIFNSSDKQQTFIIETNTAVTNSNGIIDYTISKKEQTKDSSMKHVFSELITHEPSVTVEAQSSKQVVFKLAVPNQSFDGIILGGIHVRQKDTEQKKGQISNTYSYALGVVLQENDKKIVPELKVNKVAAGLKNYRPQVSVNIQNTQPINISGLKVKAVIKKAGSNKEVKISERQNLSMAPNSNFDYSISWEDQRLEPGNYEMTLTAEDDKENSWEFKRDFTISKNEAEKTNKSALGLETGSDNQLIYFGMILITIVGLFLLYLHSKNKRVALELERVKQTQLKRGKEKKKRKNSSSR